MSDKNLQGKIALVTGGSRGLGPPRHVGSLQREPTLPSATRSPSTKRMPWCEISRASE